jgi:hypothetical protein
MRPTSFVGDWNVTSYRWRMHCFLISTDYIKVTNCLWLICTSHYHLVLVRYRCMSHYHNLWTSLTMFTLCYLVHWVWQLETLSSPFNCTVKLRWSNDCKSVKETLQTQCQVCVIALLEWQAILFAISASLVSVPSCSLRRLSEVIALTS